MVTAAAPGPPPEQAPAGPGRRLPERFLSADWPSPTQAESNTPASCSRHLPERYTRAATQGAVRRESRSAASASTFWSWPLPSVRAADCAAAAAPARLPTDLKGRLSRLTKGSQQMQIRIFLTVRPGRSPPSPVNGEADNPILSRLFGFADSKDRHSQARRDAARAITCCAGAPMRIISGRACGTRPWGFRHQYPTGRDRRSSRPVRAAPSLNEPRARGIDVDVCGLHLRSRGSVWK